MKNVLNRVGLYNRRLHWKGTYASNYRIAFDCLKNKLFKRVFWVQFKYGTIVWPMK